MDSVLGLTHSCKKDFLGNNAASNIKNARFYSIFLKLLINMVWKPEPEPQ
jgi:hypothetical protein